MFVEDASNLEIKRRLANMSSALIGRDSNSPAPTTVTALLAETIDMLCDQAKRTGDLVSSDNYRSLRNRLRHVHANTSNLQKIIDMLSVRFHPGELPLGYGLEGPLTSKLTTLENEMLRLSSKPELEVKVSKLEGELSSIRTDLAKSQTDAKLERKLNDLEKKVEALQVSDEGGEKKFEDMLKTYKTSQKKVFVIMPFASDFDDVWRGGIERACKVEQWSCLRVDEIRLSTWITDDIKEYINQADVVIADITGSNPNVMFELGWALAKNKEPIVIRQQDDPVKVPFDVHGIRYIPYLNSWSGIERLHREICKYIEAIIEKSSKVAKR